MLHLSQNHAADQLISKDPLALLIGMILDQQIPLERAFAAPMELKERLSGRLDAAEIAAMDPDTLTAAFVARPALHRFPFGEQKARIFIGLLGKQLGVQPPGWEDAAGRFGQPGTFLSIADITDGASLGQVRAYKQQMKAAAKAAAAAD
jgi:hypothetical protein